MWTVCEKEVRPREPIYEHESKMIHSLNALCLVCCAYNQRTVLIVTQDDWQVMIMHLKREEMEKNLHQVMNVLVAPMAWF